MLFQRLIESRVLHYLAIAASLVLVELLVFIFLNSILGVHYLVATVISLAVATVLNWYGSRRFVFKDRIHSAQKELALVFFASSVGLIIQLLVSLIVVEGIHLIPVIGKVTAICITFFWNFWFRKEYIFNPKRA